MMKILCLLVWLANFGLLVWALRSGELATPTPPPAQTGTPIWLVGEQPSSKVGPESQ